VVLGFGFGFGYPGSFPPDSKTIFFNKDSIPVKFILKLPGVFEIISLYDEQGVFDLTDLEQQCLPLIKEADLIPAESRRWDRYEQVAIGCPSNITGCRMLLNGIPVI